ncbi:hypothetical protein AX774_g2664 [Zancudomyces culisetae]|uniref:Uncharacterized protein n=1 Tax=Zancudomyces culisetae TaxID=1213189 RepID=A0A1R1PS83_ZANCU|nr:hypothetical protein AX774_g2664 [Zancudomyces culisetae]|eukprot:OMH83814.1 hypothetical protein AX774_g2664 [Zancudomyces culisetae]
MTLPKLVFSSVSGAIPTLKLSSSNSSLRISFASFIVNETPFPPDSLESMNSSFKTVPVISTIPVNIIDKHSFFPKNNKFVLYSFC